MQGEVYRGGVKGKLNNSNLSSAISIIMSMMKLLYFVFYESRREDCMYVLPESSGTFSV